MLLPFDIFKVSPGDHFIWVDAAATFDAAKKRIEQIAYWETGEYVILDQNTGKKMSIKPSDQSAESGLLWDP